MFGDVTGDGWIDGNKFYVSEGKTATVELITTIPDGGLTVALLGTALGGIGFVNRKMTK